MAMTVESELVVWAFGVYLGNVLNTFFKTLCKDVLLPILGGLVPKNEAGKQTLVIGDVTVDVGDMLVETISATISIALVLGALSVVKSYSLVPMVGGGGKK
jgi:hypothetical protein